MIYGQRGAQVADLRGDLLEKVESRANARLIAAAPEMLNACTLAVMMLGVEAQAHRESQSPKKAEAVEGAIAVLRAAIAKAEGSAE
jgi:hypothetical protein